MASWGTPFKDGEAAGRLHPRWQEQSVREALGSMRVVVLVGARQVGKTTLARALVTEGAGFRDLDDDFVKDAAVQAPGKFVEHDMPLMIIDEVQKAPGLMSAIKRVVDRDQRPGRFLLTGSAEVAALPGVDESLAGRAQSIRLTPLTRGETLGKPPSFFERAFGQSFREMEGDLGYLDNPGLDRDDYLSLALAGGYPAATQIQGDVKRRAWHNSYLRNQLLRDLREVTGIRRLDAMAKLLSRLAAWSSKIVDVTKVGEVLELSRPTVDAYINTLVLMFIVDRVPAWVDTDYERGARRDKLFMTDSGLMASALRMRAEKVRINSDASGKLLETYVHNQLSAMVLAQEDRYELFHFRDRHGREIDFVVRNDRDEMLGIEVTAAATVGMRKARHLQWFAQNLAKGNRFTGLVLHAGGGVRRLEDRVWSAPISILWE